VDLVLDVPVAADPGGQVFRLCLVHAQVGDGVDGFGGEAFRLVEAASAASDLQRLCGVRETVSGGDRQDLDGSDLAAAVSAVVLAGGVRDGSPGPRR
jgi:hypothetical protein